MSALFGAVGARQDPELTELLLSHGADPNREPHFGDALYHSVETPDAACLRRLLEHGAEPRGSIALSHALDYERPEHVGLLLAAGADANENPLLVHAVRRGRGPECLRLLVEHGADLDRPGGEWSTPPEEYRTAYQNAVLRGRDDAAELLANLGASTEVAPQDLAVSALARGNRPAEPLPDRLSADAQEVLILAALGGRLEPIVAELGPNFFGHAGGGPPGSLLHHAGWVGNPRIVSRLLELGADPAARSGAEFDTPIAWTVLGSEGYRAPGRDYVAVVEQLIAAGAGLEPRFLDVAHGPLAGWLENRI
jgi:ankyrin repeat protein